MPDRLTLREVTVANAWNGQGDPADVTLALPSVPNTVPRDGESVAFWLGPRSWLVFGERLVTTGSVAVFDVSASRVAWTLRGPNAATVLAKHCPLDFHASRFAPGTCAQSLFGQVNALYYRHLDPESFTLFVARSFAHDVAHHLRQSAAQYGYDEIASRRFAAD